MIYVQWVDVKGEKRTPLIPPEAGRQGRTVCFIGIILDMKWKLDDVLKIKDFDKLLAEVEADFLEYKKLIANPRPNMSEEKFKKIIDFGEKLSNKLSRLGGLPSLILATDTKNQEARLMENKANDLGLKISEETIKFSHWMKGVSANSLDEKNAKRLFKSIPDLEYSLNYSRKAAKYSLKENEEKIIMNKDTNLEQAIDDLRELIQTGFRYKIGKKEIKTQAELLNYVYSKKANERKEAYTQLLEKQKENIDKFFVIYQAIVKDWSYEAKIRNYKSPIAVRNFANEMDDEVVEVLLRVVKKNKGVFEKYFEKKAKKLGVKKINRMDLYVPIEIANNLPVGGSYDKVIKIVLKTFEEFSPRFAKAAKMIIDKKHIDVYPGENKRSGAFCATLNREIDPYIMLNHTGKLRDISTLAHELGHGVHSIYANKHYSSVQSANLPLAETASTLAELLIFEKFKKEMLWEKMGDMYATILRQTYFTLFEKEAHEKIKNGITEKDLSEMYLNNLKEQFGESVEVPDIFRYEWSYVSHFFSTPFYCYAYSFGQLLTLSLYGEYKKDKGFLKKIEEILEAGGSQNPEKLLKSKGIDIKDEKFWQKGFDIIKIWIDNL